MRRAAKQKRVQIDQKGIGFADFLLLLAAGLGVLTFYLPSLIQPKVDPGLKAEAVIHLKIIAEAVQKLEESTKLVAGYPGPHPCVNSMEFSDLTICRLGLTCQDGKYQNWEGPYLKEIPKDPWGRAYYLDNDFYQNGKALRVLGSFGPNGHQDYGSDSDDIVHVLCEQKGKST